MRNLILTFGILVVAQGVFSQEKMTKKAYIDKWSDVAVQNMTEYNIPASITLAQGILESSYGNSYLATKANNHFGIKCHDWKGKKVYRDDDKKNECFRKYKDASESYTDHSLFLTGRSRYAFLFEYDTDDYKSWAKGLKKAGYATNPKYPALLIKIIEQNNLTQYDLPVAPEQEDVVELIVASAAQPTIQTIEITENSHQVLTNKNKMKYVKVQSGDTFYRISKEFDFSLGQLYRWNDFSADKDVLAEGDIVYLMPKRKRSREKNANIKLTNSTTLRELSQSEGIRLKSLLELNNTSSPDESLNSGEVVFLR